MATHSSLVKAFILTTALFVAFSAEAWTVYAWGGTTHISIADNASRVFSSGSFFSAYISTIKDYSTKPDQWKSTDPQEQYRHWYHVDIPHTREQYWEGVLPWALEDNFALLVQRLAARNWTGAAQLAGVVSHYIADASMPLHATSDYNPGGNHVAFESEVNNRLGEISIPTSSYVPMEIENVFASAMAMLEESYGFTGYTPDKLSYWLQLDVLWNSTLRSITENRLRSAVQLTANVWYTAMIRAGLTIQAPSLLSPDNNSLASPTPTLTWSAVYGVNSYDLQLATDASFTTNVITVKGLSSTSYTVSSPLSYGTWYWRVRSGDNSTHVGLWSQPRQFDTGKVNFELATLYKISLDINIHLETGPTLATKFLSYNDDERGEVVIWSGSTPADVVLLENVAHPLGEAVEKVSLVLKDGDTVLSTLGSFVVRRGSLLGRIIKIKSTWPYAGSAERSALLSEIIGIKGKWPYAPS